MAGQKSLMIAQFPGGGSTRQEVANYVARLTAQLETDKRFHRVDMWFRNNTPITMTRNESLLVAERARVDYVLMIDNDMLPDLYLGHENAKPFFHSSLDFMLAHRGPCVVAAPYCGPPPHECCYIFQWVNHQGDNPNPDFAIEMVPRHQAAMMSGIHPAAALPTGLILIDMRAVERLPHPRFYYEWKDETESEKASTEDVTFTRDLTCAGVPIYCNWDAWAGHFKDKLVAKPERLSPNAVPNILRQQAQRNILENTLPTAAKPRIRPHNTFAKLPPTYPIELVRQRAAPVVEMPGDDDGPFDPEKDVLAASNGQPVGG